MGSHENNQNRIETIANESLETFAKIADEAKSQLASSSPRTSDVFADSSSPEARRNLELVLQGNVSNNQALCHEPSIARVVVLDEDGIEATYYICRVAPMSLEHHGIKLASYRSPVGRLASLPVGAEHTLGRGDQLVFVEVLEYSRYKPILEDGIWDARDSVLEGESYGPLTIKSLRTFLRQNQDKIDATLLDSLLEEESEAENIRKGLRRSVIEKMDLRDQPILDQYQDRIFRLPLNSRLLILGAPGTGKTTTLIRRLGQKLDVEFLDENEKKTISINNSGWEPDHAQNWIMFTPTKLLQLYVKEAFNREGIPAPDTHISTWSDFRDHLARNEFKILRSASSNSSYVMKESAHTLKAETETDPIAWFTDFDQWQKSMFWKELRKSADDLKENPSQEVAEFGKKLLQILHSAGAEMQPSIFVSLMDTGKAIGELVKKLKGITDKKILSMLNLQVNRDRQFLDNLASFIEELSDLQDDYEDQDADEDTEPNQLRIGRAAASNHYMRAVRTQARALARNRNVTKSSKTGRLIEWLGDRSLPEQDLRDIGESLLVQSALRRFVNPVQQYINHILTRYNRFRRTRQTEKRWYKADGFNPSDINPLEVDVVLLTMIRSTNDLIKRAPGLNNTDSLARTTLERLQRLYRTQVLVDEATDFSPIQLSCMAALSHPSIQSFFACGDFNQRITSWGTRSVEQMKWAIPDIEIQTISVVYRQSLQLNTLARQIVNISGGNVANVVLPDYAENEGVPPVLALHMNNEVSTIAMWLAHRIQEIEYFILRLPSIAVLVNSEEEVFSIASALSDALTDQNIRVIPCPDGQVQGQDSAVRVFNVKHIKGLEFEAVFFIGIDRLAEIQPNLYDKYLYVGTTRAATYLGITCEQGFPSSMAELQELFQEEGWR